MINQIKQPVFTFIGVIFTSAALSGCVIHVNAKDHPGNYDYHKDKSEHSSHSYTSTNKSVSVPSQTTTGNVKSVNGKVTIADNVTAEYVSSVNGKISIGDHVSVERIKVVNGKVDIQKHFLSSGDITSVNGSINIEENSTVGGDISSVNGSIKLNGVIVAEDIITKNGNMRLRGATVVKGDIIYQEINRSNSWNKDPVLSISADSNVEGSIILNREVTLEFEDAALLNKVKRNY